MHNVINKVQKLNIEFPDAKIARFPDINNSYLTQGIRHICSTYGTLFANGAAPDCVNTSVPSDAFDTTDDNWFEVT